MVGLRIEKVIQIIWYPPKFFLVVIFPATFRKNSETFVKRDIIRVVNNNFFACHMTTSAKSQHTVYQAAISFGIEHHGIVVGFICKECSERRKYHNAHPHAESNFPSAFLGELHARCAYYVVKNENRHRQHGGRTKSAFLYDRTERCTDKEEYQTGQRHYYFFVPCYVIFPYHKFVVFGFVFLPFEIGHDLLRNFVSVSQHLRAG